MSVEKLYDAIRSGRVNLQDLNDEGKSALRDYMQIKQDDRLWQGEGPAPEGKWTYDELKGAYNNPPQDIPGEGSPEIKQLASELFVDAPTPPPLTPEPESPQIAKLRDFLGSDMPDIPAVDTVDTTPLWRQGLGAVNRFGEELFKGAHLDNAIKTYGELHGWQEPAPEYQADMNLPSSETAGKAGRFVGQALPWAAAGLATGGLADIGGAAAGGAELLGGSGAAQALANLITRGAATGLGHAAYEELMAPPQEKPDITGINKDILTGAGFELGGAAASKLLPEALPQIVSSPIRAATGAVAGTGATYPLLTDEERQDFGKQLLQTGGTIAAADLLTSLFGGRGAAFRPTRETPAEPSLLPTPEPPVEATAPPRDFSTQTPDYTINNSRDFAGGRDFSGRTDWQIPSNYLEQPARSGGSVQTIPGPEQRVQFTPDEAEYSKYALDESAAGRQPVSPQEWWQSNQPPVNNPAIPRKLSIPNTEQDALAKLQDGIQEAQNYVRHNDILAAYPPGTTVEAAMSDIKANTGVDLPKLMSDYDAAKNTPGLRDQVAARAENAPLARVAGVAPIPKGIYRPGWDVAQPPEFRFGGKRESPSLTPSLIPGPLPRQPFERQGQGFVKGGRIGRRGCGSHFAAVDTGAGCAGESCYCGEGGVASRGRSKVL